MCRHSPRQATSHRSILRWLLRMLFARIRWAGRPGSNTCRPRSRRWSRSVIRREPMVRMRSEAGPLVVQLAVPGRMGEGLANPITVGRWHARSTSSGVRWSISCRRLVSRGVIIVLPAPAALLGVQADPDHVGDRLCPWLAVGRLVDPVAHCRRWCRVHVLEQRHAA
jgi:hypothetical protein